MAHPYYKSAKEITMYHYEIVNQLDASDVILDSSRREDFDGYFSFEKAYLHGLAAKIENRLSDNYIVYVKGL